MNSKCRIFTEDQTVRNFNGIAGGDVHIAVEDQLLIGDAFDCIGAAVKSHDGGIALVFDSRTIIDVFRNQQTEVCAAVITVFNGESSAQSFGIDVFVVTGDSDTGKDHVTFVNSGIAVIRHVITAEANASCETSGKRLMSGIGVVTAEIGIGVPDVAVNGDGKIEIFCHSLIKDKVVTVIHINDEFICNDHIFGQLAVKFVCVTCFDLETEVTAFVHSCGISIHRRGIVAHLHDFTDIIGIGGSIEGDGDHIAGHYGLVVPLRTGSERVDVGVFSVIKGFFHI